MRCNPRVHTVGRDVDEIEMALLKNYGSQINYPFLGRLIVFNSIVTSLLANGPVVASLQWNGDFT